MTLAVDCNQTILYMMWMQSLLLKQQTGCTIRSLQSYWNYSNSRYDPI